MRRMHRRSLTLALVATAAAASPAMAWTGAGLVAGTWHGTAQSRAKPDFTFPVQANVSLAADGTPSANVQLQSPLGCRVHWTATAQRGAVTTFAETIVRDPLHKCTAGGTVTLSPASGGRVRYVWTQGDLASFGYLDGLAGQWHGTVTQRNGRSVTMTAIVRGTTLGGIQGSVGYGPALSCSGRWVPTDATPAPGWRHFTERITRTSSANCVGLGNVALRLRSDGRLQYRWWSGPFRTVGTLDREAQPQ